MSNLSNYQIESAPPFSYCGVDVFGSFYIKERRTELKRYGILFTCLLSRGIRVEILPSLETIVAYTFINALRRFIYRNGPVRHLICDRGTNLVGARNELNYKKIRELNNHSCDFIDFKFNFPASSHMGGVWERQIMTVRSVLSNMLPKTSRQLNDDGLKTFMSEAEAIVNGRPLTVENLNSSDLLPLSPNNLMTMKSKVILPPPGKFNSSDLFTRKRWRRIQNLANEY